MPQQDDTTIELFSQNRQISDLRAELAARDAEIERLKAELAAIPKAELWWYWNITEFSQATVNYNARSINEKTRTIQRWFAAMDYDDDD